MIKPIMRCKSESLSKCFRLNSKLKVFSRKNENEEQRLDYQEGVTEITNMRRTLSLSRDTTFLAIDLFKGCLKKKFGLGTKNIQLLYVACVYVAAKINEVLMLNVEEAIEGCESFVKREDIFRMQARILNAFNFDLPFEQNLAVYVSNLIKDVADSKTIANKCYKALLESLRDPYFFNLDNKEIASAVFCIYCPDEAKEKGVLKKSLLPIIAKLNKMEKQKKILKFNYFKEKTLM